MDAGRVLLSIPYRLRVQCKDTLRTPVFRHYPIITASIDRYRPDRIKFVLLEVEFTLRGVNNVLRISRRIAAAAKAFLMKSIGYSHFVRIFFEKRVNRL